MEDRARLSAVLRVADSMLAAAMVARVTSACAELASVVDGQHAVHGELQVPPGYVAPAQSDAFCMVCRCSNGSDVINVLQSRKISGQVCR